MGTEGEKTSGEEEAAFKDGEKSPEKEDGGALEEGELEVMNWKKKSLKGRSSPN